MDARREFIYLTTTRWKTSKEHEIEIWFVEHRGRYIAVSELGKRSHWVQNIAHDASVKFQVKGELYSGSARLVESDSEPEVTATVRKLMGSKYN